MSLPANPGQAPVRPEPEVMIHQIARHWCAWSRLNPALSLAEPLRTGAASASVYAGVPLPAITHRQPLACSLTLAATEPPDAASPRTRVVVIAEAHGAVRKAALRMLLDLRALLMPGERPWCHRPSPAGTNQFDLGGLAGIPPFDVLPTGGSIALWRIRGVEIVSEPQPLAIEAGPSATPDGQGSAQMTFAIWGVPDVLAAPVPHFVVRHDGTGGVTAATVAISASPLSVMTLSRQAGSAAAVVSTIDLAQAGTIEDLMQAINALGGGWVAELPAQVSPTADLERQAIDLEPRAATSAMGAGATLRAWA